MWVCDEDGGMGKTWFSKFLIANEGAFRCTNARTKDVSYAYNKEKVVVFDFSRTLEDRVNYDIIEQLCNGLLFSSKYESHQKYFKRPKILVCANFRPDVTKLSKDRWDIWDYEYNLIVTGKQ